MIVSGLVINSKKSIESAVMSPGANDTGPGVRRGAASTQNFKFLVPVLIEFLAKWVCRRGPSTWNPTPGRPHFCGRNGSKNVIQQIFEELLFKPKDRLFK